MMVSRFRQPFAGVDRLLVMAGWRTVCSVVAFASVAVLPAQDPGPPSLRCASVNVAGDVTLTWAPTTDPGGLFVEYRIYRADLPQGPYLPLPITVPAIGTSIFFDATANADAAQRFYYMTTAFGAGGESATTDTVSTLFIDLEQSVPAGAADITWAPQFSAASSAEQASIWMEYPIGTWSQVGLAPLTAGAYSHIISICEDSLTFRIGVQDPIGCISFSNLRGDVFADVTPPGVPVITVVSVDTLTGLSTVTWQPPPELDTDGYIILWNTPTGGVIQDTVWGRLNTFYSWPLSLAGTRPEGFLVAAFDTCLIGTPPNEAPNTSATGATHTGMYLTTAHDRCGGTMTLSWSAYVGWEVGIHRVYVQRNGGAWTLLGESGAGDNDLTHPVDPGVQYCYVVRAEREDAAEFSLSNKACRFTDYPPLPQSNYIRSVSVTGPTTITVVDSVDVLAVTAGYQLLRSDNGAPFEQVATFPATAGPVITYVDEDLDPANVGYRYRMVVLDSCGREAVTSNTAGNMVLRATPDLQGRNTLQWNGYAEWNGAVGAYIIHRSIDGGAFTPIGTVAEPTWSFVDDVNAFTGSGGRFCYVIEAVEVGGSLGIDARSFSNEACAVQQDLVYIPTGFIIGGASPTFRPVLAYANTGAYELSIINRWGQIIWTTTDADQGWDGRVSGKPVPTGVYAYYCAYRTGADLVVEKRGTVTVLGEP
jgi:gliding motility-associated-like protein